MIEQGKFTYPPLGKAFEKQIKTIEDQGIKPVAALKALNPEENQELGSIEGLFPKKMRNNIKEWGEKIYWKDLKHKTNKYIWFLTIQNNKIYW